MVVTSPSLLKLQSRNNGSIIFMYNRYQCMKFAEKYVVFFKKNEKYTLYFSPYLSYPWQTQYCEMNLQISRK